ncbi:MAG: transposase, partial [Thermodesulfobacteriota bacterium]|nr:transposase [Thermodesulfobacteriota bacterium]
CMARKPRVHSPAALYHVIARGNQRQDIFVGEKDFQKYLSLLSEYKSRYPFRLYAYALMRNHVHLLLEVEATPLSKIMQGLQFRYTQYFNWRYGKVGHLFQGRYKAILCEKDSYLLELVRYIHLNPIRSKVVKDPEKYRWTSYWRYLSKGKDDLIDEEFVLNQFGRNKGKTRKRYREFVLEGLGLGHQDKYYEVKDQRFLGEDEFIERMESKKMIEGIVFYEIPIEEIVKEVENRIGITRDRMYSQSRGRRGAYGRSLVGYLARRLSGCLVKDVGKHFRREPMTISLGIARVEDLLRGDEGLARKIGLIEKELVWKKKKKYFITNA